MAEVAVLLPVRNAGPYVAQALLSVLAQDHRDLDVIVVDDGSDDATMAEVERVADARVRVVKGPGRGVAAALAAGADAADARFLCRMDADDVCLPGRVRAQVQHLRAEPRCGVVGGRFRTISAADRPLPTLTRLLPERPGGCRLHLGFANCIAHPTAMVRTQALREVGGYDVSTLFEDYDLWLRLAREWSVTNLPVTVLRYRYHAGNTYRARRQEAVAQLAPRLSRYCRDVLELDLPERAAQVLLDPAARLASDDRPARQQALQHLQTVVDRARGSTDAPALRARAQHLAVQVAMPTLSERPPLVPRASSWSALPRLLLVGAARRVVR